jgi:hypothetical protein
MTEKNEPYYHVPDLAGVCLAPEHDMDNPGLSIHRITFPRNPETHSSEQTTEETAKPDRLTESDPL